MSLSVTPAGVDVEFLETVTVVCVRLEHDYRLFIMLMKSYNVIIGQKSYDTSFDTFDYCFGYC